MNYKLTALLLIIGMLVIASEATSYYPHRRYPYGHHYGHGHWRHKGDEDLKSIIADVLNELDENLGTEE